jgi:Domain of unknown function (DUF3303)
MLFVMTYKISQATRNAAQDRFRKGGGLPPAGVKMLGRWHYADGSGGVVLAETADPVALAQWSQDWSDVISLESRPVIDDTQIAKVLGS